MSVIVVRLSDPDHAEHTTSMSYFSSSQNNPPLPMNVAGSTVLRTSPMAMTLSGRSMPGSPTVSRIDGSVICAAVAALMASIAAGTVEAGIVMPDLALYGWAQASLVCAH